MYSQNKEEQHILEYFGENIGTILDIGANDGKTFSNSLALIEKGWQAVLVEPSPSTFEKLMALHKGTKNDVVCVKAAIGAYNGKTILHESGAHLKDKSDFALLSTVNANEKIKWNNVEFKEIEVDIITYESLQQLTKTKSFDFISIDCEGNDVMVLKQINLTDTQLVCIEHNGNQIALEEVRNYCKEFGLVKEIYFTGENIILGK